MPKPLRVRIRRTRNKLANTRKWLRHGIKRRKRTSDPDKKKRRRKVVKKLKKAVKRIARRLRQLVKERRRRNKNRIVLAAGAPHWGGSDDILRIEVEPVARKWGYRPNSAKRSETYGNPDSDHHTSQLLASARDFPTANNHALKNAIGEALGIGPMADYQHYYIVRKGRRFRVQAIASTHGTGPHLHLGVRRV